MLWTLKAFFCNNIKSVLQHDSQLQAVKARDVIHGFEWIPPARRLKLHAINYMAITYGYFGLHS